MNIWREIPVELIDRNPDQPRTTFDEAALDELATSIKAHGVIQPIEVEERAGRYMLHHGERRWRASKIAGRETIPAIVAAPQDGEGLLIRGLLENLHREDLNPIEEALVFRRLIDAGWTRTRIYRETGVNLNTIGSRLAWLDVEPEIQVLVARGKLPRDGRLAQAFRVLTPEVRVPLAEKLAARRVGLKGSLNAIERAAEKLAEAATIREAGRHPVPMIRHGAPAIPVGANGNAPRIAVPVKEAADAMCRACHWRPKGDFIPAWELIEQMAAETCEACQKKDGPALPEICRNCPGVALVKALTRKMA